MRTIASIAIGHTCDQLVYRRNSSLHERSFRPPSPHQASGTLTDEKAKELAAKWFAVQEERMALWKKYYGQIEEALSPIRAAQFVQVENQVALVMD